MASHGEGHVVGYTPAKTNEGWGAAIFICVLTASLALMAYVIHVKTYEDFTDPRSRNMARPAAVHEAPAAGAATTPDVQH